MIILEYFAGNALAWLWQISLAATLLIALVLALQVVSGRFLSPRWTYALWLLVAVRLVLPFAPESRVSIFNLGVPTPSEIRPVTSMESFPQIASVPRTSERQVPAKPLTLRFEWRAWLAIMWLTGAAGHLLCCTLQYRRLRVWVRRQSPVQNPVIVAALRRAQETLGFRRAVFLVETNSFAAPSVLGIFLPILLLPKTLLETWSTRELELVFLHKLIHVRRRDNLLNWFLIVVQALHWFNPLVWFALRRLRAEREALCDEIALSHLHPEARPDYGSVLLKVAEQDTHFRFAPGVVPILNHKHEIQRRITMITRFKPTTRLATIAAVALILVLACLTFTAAAQKEKPATEPAKPNPTVNGDKPVPKTRELQHQKTMKTLEIELDRLNAQIQEAETTMEDLRHRRAIPSYVAQGDGTQPGPETENIRRFSALQADAARDEHQLANLYKNLKSLERPELKKAILTAVPDTHLSMLLDRLAEAEQKLASLSVNFGKDHPEVASLARVIDQINR